MNPDYQILVTIFFEPAFTNYLHLLGGALLVPSREG